MLPKARQVCQDDQITLVAGVGEDTVKSVPYVGEKAINAIKEKLRDLNEKNPAHWFYASVENPEKGICWSIS